MTRVFGKPPLLIGQVIQFDTITADPLLNEWVNLSAYYFGHYEPVHVKLYEDIVITGPGFPLIRVMFTSAHYQGAFLVRVFRMPGGDSTSVFVRYRGSVQVYPDVVVKG